MNLNFIAAGLLIAAGAGWLLTHDYRTVQKERARVEAQAKKTNDRAQEARRRIADVPVGRVLDRWYRD